MKLNGLMIAAALAFGAIAAPATVLADEKIRLNAPAKKCEMSDDEKKFLKSLGFGTDSLVSWRRAYMTNSLFVERAKAGDDSICGACFDNYVTLQEAFDTLPENELDMSPAEQSERSSDYMRFSIEVGAKIIRPFCKGEPVDFSIVETE